MRPPPRNIDREEYIWFPQRGVGRDAARLVVVPV